MTVIGVDLGGSGSRITASDGSSAFATGPAFAVVDGRADHASAIARLARQLGPLKGRVEVVALSIAGLVALGEPAVISAAIAREWPGASAVICSDAVAAVMAAWGEQGGAVVAAGTGSVGFATNFRSVWRRSDGWGHLLGDEGGASWIGARGIAAALREVDGRHNGSSVLLEALTQSVGAPQTAPERVRSSPNAATFLADFARHVTAAADRGDAQARLIVERAIDHLVDTGLSVLTEAVPERLALVGGLATVPRIARGFATRVSTIRPGVTVEISPSSPLDGAVRLAQLSMRGQLDVQYPPYLHIINTPIAPHLEGAQ